MFAGFLTSDFNTVLKWWGEHKTPLICLKGERGTVGATVTENDIQTYWLGALSVPTTDFALSEKSLAKKTLRACRRALYAKPLEEDSAYPSHVSLVVQKGPNDYKILRVEETIPRKDYFCFHGTLENKKVNSHIENTDIEKLLSEQRIMGTFGPYKKHDGAKQECFQAAHILELVGQVTVVRAQDNKISAIATIPERPDPFTAKYDIVKDKDDMWSPGMYLSTTYMNANMVKSGTTQQTKQAALEKAINDRLRDDTTISIKGAYEGKLLIVSSDYQKVVGEASVELDVTGKPILDKASADKFKPL
jgi:hypothetical protein